MKYYLAIDIGASSGRHIIGWRDNGSIKTREVYRFSNGVDNIDGDLVWNIARLFKEVKAGLKVAFSIYKQIESTAIDTWGVDYVLLDGSGKEILPCYAYRDSRTSLAIQQVHARMQFDCLYLRTGIQFQPFNTIYQLYADMTKGRLKDASAFLMLPEYFNYKLTGIVKKEYTNATTTGITNIKSKQFDEDIINALKLPKNLFLPLGKAGDIVGGLSQDIAVEVGGQTLVKLCASHDTASAFEAVDMEEDSILISSGTWSLIGAKLKDAKITKASKRANFTNEGGVGYIRFLKNITGLWFNIKLSQEFNLNYPKMQSLAKTSQYYKIFDVNDPAFNAPESMSKAIKHWFVCRGIAPPKTQADYINSVYLSLAAGYKKAIEEIEALAATKYNTIYIVGGGALVENINAYTAELTGKNVIALPIEATAIGNLKAQMR